MATTFNLPPPPPAAAPLSSSEKQWLYHASFVLTPLAALLIFFAAAGSFFLLRNLLRRLASARWLHRDGNHDGVRGPRRWYPGGLHPVVLKSFPIVVHPAGGSGDCAVCLAAFAEMEELRLLPACGHVFHRGCADTWLAMNATCPICRADQWRAVPSSAAASKEQHIIQI